MTINNVFGHCSESALVDKMLGTSYAVVRYVAQQMEHIKHVSAHMAEIYRIHGSISELDALAAEIAKLDAVHAELASLLLIAEHIGALSAVGENIPEILAIHADLPELVELVPLLPLLTSLAASLTALQELHGDLPELVELHANLAMLSDIRDNMADLIEALNNAHDLIDARITDQPTAVVGTNNTELMTPLRTHQAVQAYGRTALWQQGGTGAKISTIDDELKAHAIRPDQFKLGSDSDDTSSFLRARDRWIATGMPYRIRAGDYNVSSLIEFDLSAVSTFDEEGRYSIVGDGTGITGINLPGSALSFIRVIGGTSAGLEHHGLISGFAVNGNGAGRALEVIRGGDIRVDDVKGFALDEAFYLVDCLSSVFFSVIARWSKRGVSAVRSTFTHPNALSFYDCKMGNCHEWGLSIEGGSALTYHGGSIEGCGLTGSGADRGGILLFNPGNEGGVACNVQTYFEQNGPDGDLVVIVGDKPIVCNVNGSLFNKVGATEPNLADHHIHVIQAPGKADVKVNIGGAAFRSYDGYVPSTARRVVKFTASGNYSLHGQNAAIFQNPVERPDHVGTEPIAVCRFSGVGAIGSKAFTNANNVSVVTKIATGHYRVTLMQATGISSKSVQVTTNDFACGTQIVGESTNSVDFYVYNSSGVLADATNITARVYDG